MVKEENEGMGRGGGTSNVMRSAHAPVTITGVIRALQVRREAERGDG